MLHHHCGEGGRSVAILIRRIVAADTAPRIIIAAFIDHGGGGGGGGGGFDRLELGLEVQAEKIHCAELRGGVGIFGFGRGFLGAGGGV